MEEKYDLAIVGAGPVGLYTGYFAALHGLKTIILESLEQVGGQPAQLYPAKDLLDVPAFARITGASLTTKLLEQLKTENVALRTGFKVESITKNADQNNLTINDELSVKTVIIATGAGAFKPKKLPINIPTELDGKFHHFIKDPQHFSDKSVAVLGGGDSALDWANLLQMNGSSPTIIHRRNNFRGLDKTIAELKASEKTEFLTPYLPAAISTNEAGRVLLELKNVQDGNVIQHDFDEVMVAYGFTTNNDFVDDWGIDTENGFIKVNRQMRTNQESIYAVGDAVTYESRVPIIALGFGEAQIAVTNIMRKEFPEKKITMHSTSIK